MGVTPEQEALIAEQERAAALRAAPRPALEAIWHALEGIPDPEIPVVSIVGLGMVRSVEWEQADPTMLIVRITPTYSGCPAMELIVGAIRESMAAIGVAQLRLETQLSPAWTTDWMAPEAKRKLRDYGIAPPEGSRPAAIDVAGISPLRRAELSAPCPRCGSLQTKLVSQFGSTACKAQYRCVDCLEPFDFFKPH